MKYYYTEYLDYIDIYNITISQFMKYNPPCKECLVQNMCMRFLYNNCGSVFEFLELEFKRCDNLIDFMLYNKDFDILEKGKIKWKKIV
jgi:hypothetical protein